MALLLFDFTPEHDIDLAFTILYNHREAASFPPEAVQIPEAKHCCR